MSSVTRLGDFLHFGQQFKAGGNNSKPVATIILPKLPTLLGNFCKGAKIIHFLIKSYLGNFYRHLAIFIWSHCYRQSDWLVRPRPYQAEGKSDRSYYQRRWTPSVREKAEAGAKTRFELLIESEIWIIVLLPTPFWPTDVYCRFSAFVNDSTNSICT